MSNPTTPIPIMEFYEGMHMKHFVLYPDSITIVRAEGYRETARSDQSKCRVRGETIAKGDERMAYRVVPLCMTVDLEPDGIGGAERITQRELISFTQRGV